MPAAGATALKEPSGLTVRLVNPLAWTVAGSTLSGRPLGSVSLSNTPGGLMVKSLAFDPVKLSFTSLGAPPSWQPAAALLVASHSAMVDITDCELFTR